MTQRKKNLSKATASRDAITLQRQQARYSQREYLRTISPSYIQTLDFSNHPIMALLFVFTIAAQIRPVATSAQRSGSDTRTLSTVTFNATSDSHIVRGDEVFAMQSATQCYPNVSFTSASNVAHVKNKKAKTNAKNMNAQKKQNSMAKTEEDEISKTLKSMSIIYSPELCGKNEGAACDATIRRKIETTLLKVSNDHILTKVLPKMRTVFGPELCEYLNQFHQQPQFCFRPYW